MSKDKHKSSHRGGVAADTKPKKSVSEPIDVVDGIPDHCPSRSRRWLPIVFGLFALWMAFLLYCLLAGRI